MDRFFSQKHCDRCGGSLEGGRIMSMFNEQCICMGCKEKETKDPEYNKAVEADWFGNTFLDKFYKVFFSLSIRSLRLPLTTSLHGYEFRRSRQIQMIMPSAFGYHTHAHYQGFASPISVADRQSVFDCPMNHGFADSSTNECSQKAEYVVRLTFQKCVDG